MDQDPDKLNRSPIGHKIFAVHAPFPFFGHATAGNNPLVRNIITNILYGRNRIPHQNFQLVAEKTFRFAKTVGAKVVVFHSYSLGENIGESLALLASLEKQYKMIPTVEHEGPYNHHAWQTDPKNLLKVLDKASPAKKFSLCLDTCSLIGCGLPVEPIIKNLLPRLGHVHLADTLTGRDSALEIHSPVQITALNILYAQKYSGFITAEVNGTVGKKEEFEAQIYGLFSKFGGSFLKKTVYQNARRHIENSCQYLLTSLS